MESIDFFQVFIIIIILIITLFYIYFRSLTSSSSAAVAAVDTDIPPLQEKYDVFISFRGEDTRDAFTSHLHKALQWKKIETYIDYRLEKGDDIGTALLEAIEKSKIALVIFSKDFASSTWCLKELVHILGCKKSHGQIVIPIFYRIDPSHVRKQKGTYALGGLLWRLKKRFKGSMDEVVNWRAALEEAANMAGFHYSSKTGMTEADFVEEVVQDVLTKSKRESSSDLKGESSSDLKGIERKIEQIESLLCLDSPGVCCVGIWGMGGIGKTTLATAVFHRHSSKFEAACFLANVREISEQPGGLNLLLNELVREILKDKDINIGTLSIPPQIQKRLRRTKALIVLDDVSARKQLEVLVGGDDRFRRGSRIIITATDKDLLEQKVKSEKIYNVEGLSPEEALELFHSHAFGNKSPTTDYTELAREVVDYVKGNPSALKVMGSSFRRCKSKQEWEDQISKLERFPNEEIMKKFRVSYDGLEEHEQKIFLDIACFHNGYEMKYVIELLANRGFFGKEGIEVLIERSLISISKDLQSKKWLHMLLDMESEKWQNMLSERWIDMQSQGWIEMHNLVQEMGRAIARKQRSRLFAEDVYKALTNNQRDRHIQAISFDVAKIEKQYSSKEKIEKQYQLRCIRVRVGHQYTLIGSLDRADSLGYLDWRSYHLKSLPSKFYAQNLLVLDMSSSEVGELWSEAQCPVYLISISLGFSQHQTEVPCLTRSKKIEFKDLDGCKKLADMPSYLEHLHQKNSRLLPITM